MAERQREKDSYPSPQAGVVHNKEKVGKLSERVRSRNSDKVDKKIKT